MSYAVNAGNGPGTVDDANNAVSVGQACQY
jgi:hypothetical protein